MQGVSRRRWHRSSNPLFDETLKTSPNQRSCFRLARPDSRPSGLAGKDRTTATSALQSIGKTKATLEGRRIGSSSMTDRMPAPSRRGGATDPKATVGCRTQMMAVISKADLSIALSKGRGRSQGEVPLQAAINLHSRTELHRAATQKQASRTRLGCDWPP